jgi:hypothetical protein
MTGEGKIRIMGNLDTTRGRKLDVDKDNGALMLLTAS